MDAFDVFLGHDLADVEERLKSVLNIDTLPVISKDIPFSWDIFLSAAFEVIPDHLMPSMDITYKTYEKKEIPEREKTEEKIAEKIETLEIDRQYVYDICYQDIINTSRFHFKNKQPDKRCSYNSLWQSTHHLSRKRNISLMKETYLFSLFDIQGSSRTGYFIPEKHSKLIQGLIISIKNCPILDIGACSIAKSSNFYYELLQYEKDIENLHFVEQYFSISLLQHIAHYIPIKKEFAYDKEAQKNIIKHITKLPNVIGRIGVIHTFLTMSEIKSVKIMNYYDSSYYNIENDWYKSLAYISLKISRSVYPIWEALVIVLLNTYFQDSSSLIDNTASNTAEEVKKLYMQDNAEFTGSKGFDDNLFRDICTKNFERFYSENELNYYEYICESEDLVTVREIKLEPQNVIVRESDLINYRSIFFQESSFNNLEPFLPPLNRLHTK